MDDLPASSKHDEASSDGRETSGPKHPHDVHGRFMHVDHTNPPQPQERKPNPISQFLHDETAIHKTNNDELIDVHIGNPLRRITELLEQIKKQKAFSFTLKGSLGLMGVVLVAGTFSILGGTKVLCDKGIQTKMGDIRQLQFKENSDRTILSYIPFLDSFLPDKRIPRSILLTPENKILHLVFKNDISPYPITPTTYLLTGNYDSCSETLTVDQQTGIQQFFN